MRPTSVPPSLTQTAFDCPHCGAFTRQKWARGEARFAAGAIAPEERSINSYAGTDVVESMWFAFCERCKAITIWYERQLIYPATAGGSSPNPDLPDEIRNDYEEARSIVWRSPRGAAALLRLCIQKLCKHLGEGGKKIDDDIASLVRKGLPIRVQQALDVVRVVGNNAVHPGHMDVKDDRETVGILFELVNLITQVMISDPKAVQEMYKSLPQSARDAIAKRDGNTP
jgi:hypothetical protein